MELLLADPPGAARAGFTPVVQEANVKWNRGMHAVQCRYYCSTAQKFRVKTMGVKKGGTDDDVQARSDAMARVMQSYYQEHHSLPPVDSDASD